MSTRALPRRTEAFGGFAGSTADSMALIHKFESRLEEFRGNLQRAAVELAKEWRTDRVLRRLEAFLVVADRESTFLLSGAGDVIAPDDGLVAVGSGGPYALAAARALVRHADLDAATVAREAMKIASEICISRTTRSVLEEVLGGHPCRPQRHLRSRYALPRDRGRGAATCGPGERPAVHHGTGTAAPPLRVAAEITPRTSLIGPTGWALAKMLRAFVRWASSSGPPDAASICAILIGRGRHGAAEDLRSAGWRRPRQCSTSASSPPSPARKAKPPTRHGTPSRARELGAFPRGHPESRVMVDRGPGRSFPRSSPGRRGDGRQRDMLPGLFGGRTRRRNLPVSEAREVLRQEEEARLVDQDQVARLAVERAQSSGIVFLDEIDKIAGREGSHGPDVSREGVQRDILPIVEGTTVSTKYGPVRTDHVLFIAAGAFHVSKPTDLIPE